MTILPLILRSLWHRRLGVLGLVLAMAVAAAAVTGGLIVGDSLRSSMREMLLSRLGGISFAVTTAAPFSTELADKVVQQLPRAGVQAALAVSGTIQREEGSAAIGGFTLLGASAAHRPLGDSRPLMSREVGVPSWLAAELSIVDGQDIILGVPRLESAGVSLFAHRRSDRLLRTVRRTARIMAGDGTREFSLEATQARPRNLILPLAALAELAGIPGKANHLLIASRGTAVRPEQLRQQLAKSAMLDDVGLRLHQGYLHARDFIIPARTVEIIKNTAAKVGGRAEPASVYIADRLSCGNAESSYAIIAATSQHQLQENEIALTDWLADDLHAQPGDQLRLSYLSPRADGSFEQRETSLRVKSIVTVDAPTAPVMPPLPGVTDADRIDAWEAPFPVDMGRVTARDDEYWRQFRTAPKAYVSRQLLQRMWSSGASADWVTAMRLEVADAAVFQKALVQQLVLGGEALPVREVEREALEASRGSSDFGSLFAGMSIFLVVSAAAIALTLARLGLEARGREVGLLTALGFSSRQLTLILGLELLLVCLTATALGVLLSVGYADVLLRLFASRRDIPWELPPLALEVRAGTLAAAAICCLLMGGVAFLQSSRFVRRLSAVQLLGSRLEFPSLRRPGRRWGGALACVLLLAGAGTLLLANWRILSPAVAFLASAVLLLLASLLLIRQVILAPSKAALLSVTSLLRASMAARRKGSLLIVSLFAVASFMLASVAMQTAGGAAESATGGFALRVTCTVAPGYDISTAAGRRQLGFTSADEAALSGAAIVPLWSRGSGDVSCLNLARPNAARVLGVETGALSASSLRLRTEPPGSGWEVLEGSGGDAIPVIGDSESMTWILKRSLGETFELPRDGRPPLRVRLVGLVDGGLFAGDLLMSRKAMTAAYGEGGGASVFLIRTVPDQLPGVRESVAGHLAPFGCQVETTSGIIERVHSVQRLYMSFFLMLGAAGLLLGAAGQAAVMIRQCFQRRGEMQLLLAQGFARGRVVAMLAAEQGALLVAGIIAGGAAAILPGAVLLGSASTLGIAGVLLAALLTGGLAIVVPLWLLAPQAREVRMAVE